MERNKRERRVDRLWFWGVVVVLALIAVPSVYWFQLQERQRGTQQEARVSDLQSSEESSEETTFDSSSEASSTNGFDQRSGGSELSEFELKARTHLSAGEVVEGEALEKVKTTLREGFNVLKDSSDAEMFNVRDSLGVRVTVYTLLNKMGYHFDEDSLKVYSSSVYTVNQALVTLISDDPTTKPNAYLTVLVNESTGKIQVVYYGSAVSMPTYG